VGPKKKKKKKKTEKILTVSNIKGVFIIGVVIQSTAISAGHASILGGRFVTGLGVGSLSMIVPM